VVVVDTISTALSGDSLVGAADLGPTGTAMGVLARLGDRSLAGMSLTGRVVYGARLSILDDRLALAGRVTTLPPGPTLSAPLCVLSVLRRLPLRPTSPLVGYGGDPVCVPLDVTASPISSSAGV